MISLRGISKSFKSRYVLDDLNLEIVKGESIAIQGRSGSGKTTLINIIGSVNVTFNGDYFFEGVNMKKLSSSKRASFRRKKIGFITQHFDLLEDRNVKSNISISLKEDFFNPKKRCMKIKNVLNQVGLSGYERKSIKSLSGGEKQRVAIARALIKKPAIIIADEPTGALDEETRNQILDLFKELIAKGSQFIIVTHDDDVAKICDKIYHIKKGNLKLKERE